MERGLDLNTLGFGVVGLFVVTWAALIWRYGRIEQKWSGHRNLIIEENEKR